MIPITKREMRNLTKYYGVWHGDYGISRSYAHNHKYYLCESEDNLAALRQYYLDIGQDTKCIDDYRHRK